MEEKIKRKYDTPEILLLLLRKSSCSCLFCCLNTRLKAC